MADELTLQVKTTLAAIHSANEAASQWLAERDASEEAHYLVNLAVEELVTNAMKYGYDDGSEHVMEIRLALEPGALVLTVTDDGRPFNPLEWPGPDTDTPVEERPPGGLGIYLLRQMSDAMEYARTGGKNRLTLRKELRG